MYYERQNILSSLTKSLVKTLNFVLNYNISITQKNKIYNNNI